MTSTQAAAATISTGELIYRFEGRLGELYPIGIFPEGIRFHNDFDARVVAGPFEGGRIFGLDQFLLRPDGIGVIDAPEVIEAQGCRVAVRVRGYVVPPPGLPVPPLEVVAEPGFEFPDVPFRVTASATLQTAAPTFAHLNHTVAVIEGTVSFATGRLDVEAHRGARTGNHLRLSPSRFDSRGGTMTVSTQTRSALTPPFELPDTLLDACRARAATYDRENRFFSEDFEDLRTHGYLGAAVPEALGGAGQPLSAIVRLQRRLAAAAPPTALALSMHLYFTGAAAQLDATGDKRVRWILDEAAQGEVFAAGHAETGNDLPVLLSTTRAERVPGGYRITGHKRFGSLGPVWTRLGVHALDADDGTGPRVVHAFVDRDQPGVEVVPEWDMHGMRATQSYDTILDGVVVPDERVVRVLPAGDPTDAWFATMGTWAFLQFGAVYLGIADRAFAIAVAEATSKTSIAVPRGTMAHNPEVQHIVADMYLDLVAAGTLLDATAADWDAHVEHPDWPARVLAAKYTAVDRAKGVVDRAFELAGAGAMRTGHELERLARDVRCGWFNGVNGLLTHEMIGKGVLGVDPQPRW